MEEIKTPYDASSEYYGAVGADIGYRKVYLEGYRAALARDVVSVEAIEAAINTWSLGGAAQTDCIYLLVQKALAEAVHALQLVPMNRERLVEILQSAERAWQKEANTTLYHAPYVVLADAVLGGRR